MLVVGLNKNDSSNMWLIHVIWTSIVVKTTGWGGDDDTAASVTPSNSHMLTSLKVAGRETQDRDGKQYKVFLALTGDLNGCIVWECVL